MIRLRKYCRTSRDTQQAFESGFFIAMLTIGPTLLLIGILIGRMGR